MVETLHLPVTGMTCGGCENAVRRSVSKLEGVEEVSASYADGIVTVRFDSSKTGLPAIRRQIEVLGYKVGSQGVL